MRASRRRGFAILAAIGVLVVLGLIVTALSDSLRTERQVSRLWRAASEERLALQWAVETLRAESTVRVDDRWGELTVTAEREVLAPDSTVYSHPALAHRAGDALARVTIGDVTHHLLLREGSPPTHHHLPEDLVPQTSTPAQEATL